MSGEADTLCVTDSLLSRKVITDVEATTAAGERHECSVTVIERDYKLMEISGHNVVTQIYHPGLTNIQINDKLIGLNGENLTLVAGADFVERFQLCMQKDRYCKVTVQRHGDMLVEYLEIECALPDIVGNSETMVVETTTLDPQKYWKISDNKLILERMATNEPEEEFIFIYTLLKEDSDTLNYAISWDNKQRNNKKYLTIITSRCKSKLIFKPLPHDKTVRTVKDSGKKFKMSRSNGHVSFESCASKTNGYFISYDKEGKVSLSRPSNNLVREFDIDTGIGDNCHITQTRK